MAKFKGTIPEFTTFIGGYARNKVQAITKAHRKRIGQCEADDCQSPVTSNLDAAHIHGKERPRIIAEILKDYLTDDIVSIDLHEFQRRFVAAHQPIEDVIRILCKPCHTKYDLNHASRDAHRQKQDDWEEPDSNEAELNQSEVKEIIQLTVEAAELKEIKKVSTRVEGWALNREKQRNGHIVETFLMIGNGEPVSLAQLCSSVTISNVSFTANYNDMRRISQNGHGKVFEQQGDCVLLWPPVKDVVLKAFGRA